MVADMFEDALTSEIPKYQMLRERLITEWPTIDDETLADTLEGITNIHEIIAAVIRSTLVDEALCAGLRLSLRGDDRRRAKQTRAARLHRVCSHRHPFAGGDRRGDDPPELLAPAASEARSADVAG